MNKDTLTITRLRGAFNLRIGSYGDGGDYGDGHGDVYGHGYGCVCGCGYTPCQNYADEPGTSRGGGYVNWDVNLDRYISFGE